MKLRSLAVVLSLLCLTALPAAAQPKKLKVYISVDMEGVVGVVTGDQLGPSGFEYQRFREFMTREALAAVQAAKEAGATEIVVSDSHGNGENLLIEQFPPEVKIIRSWPRRLTMMAGIDASFDAVIFIGYHASTDNSTGVRAHTFSSARLTHVAVNGMPFTEGAWNAAIAGHFGVPVVAISGDDAACAEVSKVVGNIETAVVKQSLGFHSAMTMTPGASYELIATKVKAGLARRAELKPFTVTKPVTVEVSFKNYLPAEVLSYLKGIERTGSHTIRYHVADMLEAADLMLVINTYNLTLEP